LPALVLLDGNVATRGLYPSRKELAELVGMDYEEDAPALVLPMAGTNNEGGCC